MKTGTDDDQEWFLKSLGSFKRWIQLRALQERRTGTCQPMVSCGRLVGWLQPSISICFCWMTRTTNPTGEKSSESDSLGLSLTCSSFACVSEGCASFKPDACSTILCPLLCLTCNLVGSNTQATRRLTDATITLVARTMKTLTSWHHFSCLVFLLVMPFIVNSSAGFLLTSSSKHCSRRHVVLCLNL